MSLRKDQRDDWYGNYAHSKGFRSKVRATSHRKARRESGSDLLSDPETSDSRFLSKQKRRWKKYPGQSLADAIANRKASRIRNHGAKHRRRAEHAARQRAFNET